jgi:polyhydroxyalkanoate synthase
VVFDLSPAQGLVRYAFDGGVAVFMVSWRHPTTEHQDWDLGT